MPSLNYHSIACEIYDILEKFEYVPDEQEHWKSHLQKVLDGESWHGDCDDFALTAAALAANRNVPHDDILIIFCLTETRGGHLVCGISDEDATWIIDNRQHTVWDWKVIPYTWLKATKYQSDTWYEIKESK